MGLAQVPNDEVIAPRLGFEPAIFRLQTQDPELLSQRPPLLAEKFNVGV